MEKKIKDLRLYDLPRMTPLRLQDAEGEWFNAMFHNLDGMYSYIEVTDGPHKGKAVHLATWTPMKKVKDHYEIDYKRA